MTIKYCTNCVIPNTKPNSIFLNGVCGACLYSINRKETKINWHQREIEFNQLTGNIKKNNKAEFDVLVPVSGGKDSLAQIHHVIKRNLKVLAFHVDNGLKTEIGSYNLNLITKMGAHLMTFKPDTKIQRKLVKIGFLKYGDPDLINHCLLHALPIRTAIKLRIPMVFLGENAALEYNGDTKIDSKKVSLKWFQKYAANNKFTAKFISRKYKIPYSKMKIYDLPPNSERKNTKAYFASYFFKWSSENNLKIAKKYGFKSLNKNSEGTYKNYVSIDEKFNRIHQYLKFLKFGYGRATDHACEDIRNKKIDREKAIKLVKKYDRKKISSYYYLDFIRLINISKQNFFKTLKKFTNHKIQSQIKFIK